VQWGVKVKQILFILVIAMLVTACVEVHNEAPEGPQGPVCNTPYILVGTDCCLDSNDNAICDTEEPDYVPETSGDRELRDESLEDSRDSRSHDSDTTADENADTGSDAADNNVESETSTIVEDVEQGACGDGTCDNGENAASCCADCGCEDGLFCSDNECKETEIMFELSPLSVWNCGDGTCSDIEDSENCCKDCGCDEGFCMANKCGEFSPIFDLAPMQLAPTFFQEQSYTEYLVVVLKEFQFLQATENHKDCLYDDFDCSYNYVYEAMVYAEAENGDNEVQKTKWPMAGFASGYDKGAGSYDEAETVTPNVPVFAIDKESLSGDVIVKILFSESDKDSVIPYINYETGYEDVKSLFSGKNDLQSEMTLTIQEGQGYRLGEHENADGKVWIKYEIREVKVLDGMTVKANLEEAELDGFPTLIDSIEADDDFEGLLFYRMTNGLFSPDDYGVGYGDEHQMVGSKNDETISYTVGLGYPLEFDVDAEYTDYAGPFLYLEYSAFERDKDCRNDDNIPVSCIITRKLANAGVITELIWMDDAALLENLGEEYSKEYYRWDNKGTGTMRARYSITRETY
jgi:hypothetical protein